MILLAFRALPYYSVKSRAKTSSLLCILEHPHPCERVKDTFLFYSTLYRGSPDIFSFADIVIEIAYITLSTNAGKDIQIKHLSRVFIIRALALAVGASVLVRARSYRRLLGIRFTFYEFISIRVVFV